MERFYDEDKQRLIYISQSATENSGTNIGKQKIFVKL